PRDSLQKNTSSVSKRPEKVSKKHTTLHRMARTTIRNQQRETSGSKLRRILRSSPTCGSSGQLSPILFLRHYGY
ncbi:hypothetical protein AAF712_016836, partial [Marasmius tenuissimus]